MGFQRQEHRKTSRRPRRRAAWLQVDGCALIPCVIWDISPHGARIGAAQAESSPERFSFERQTVKQACQVALRKDGCVGVHFQEAPS
jgi:hypothetical protein